MPVKLDFSITSVKFCVSNVEGVFFLNFFSYISIVFTFSFILIPHEFKFLCCLIVPVKTLNLGRA
jgi:hypothetical protein